MLNVVINIVNYWALRVNAVIRLYHAHHLRMAARDVTNSGCSLIS